MRLTIETTTSDPRYSAKTVIEVPYDDVDLDEICLLLGHLLRGFSFDFEGQLEVVNEAEK